MIFVSCLFLCRLRCLRGSSYLTLTPAQQWPRLRAFPIFNSLGSQGPSGLAPYIYFLDIFRIPILSFIFRFFSQPSISSLVPIRYGCSHANLYLSYLCVYFLIFSSIISLVFLNDGFCLLKVNEVLAANLLRLTTSIRHAELSTSFS